MRTRSPSHEWHATVPCCWFHVGQFIVPLIHGPCPHRLNPFPALIKGAVCGRWATPVVRAAGRPVKAERPTCCGLVELEEAKSLRESSALLGRTTNPVLPKPEGWVAAMDCEAAPITCMAHRVDAIGPVFAL